MKILGIETATIVCGAAIVVDGNVIREEQVQKKNVHAESIMRLIDGVLTQSSVGLGELDAIAVSIGPGSFTGLRIGLSVAKGLVVASEKPLVAVSTLRALAQRAVDAGVVETSFILSAIDARRDEVYCQLFRVNGNQIEAEWCEIDLSLTKLLDVIGERLVTVTGDGAAKLKSQHFKFVPEQFATCSAASVGLLGERMACMSEFVDVGTAEPKYLKEFYMTRP